MTIANQIQTSDELPPGHVRLPVVLTGSMGMALAAGLQFFGFMDMLNRLLAGLFVDHPESLLPAVPPTILWASTTVTAYGLAFVILEIPRNWRRIVIWISTMVVIAAWVPVASIANTQAPVASPLIAAAWAGLCTIIYAARHRMEADDSAETPATHHVEQTTDPEATDAND